MKQERPKDFPHIQDRAWVPILTEICDHKVPEERRIQLAKKVLRSDYQQAWIEVMVEYRRLQPDTRWGRENWLDKVAGPIRLKALKVLAGHPGPRDSHWDAAIAAMALCCKAKDLPVLLRICRLGMLEGSYKLGSMDMGWCLDRIVRWKPQDDYPELFDFIEQHLWEVEFYDRKELFGVLLVSVHPRAEALLLQAIEAAGESYWGLLGEYYLFQQNQEKYLERAQAALAHYQQRKDALHDGDQYRLNLVESALSYFQMDIEEYLESEEEVQGQDSLGA